ncbi:MAG: tetratricopeptide repeat protein [Candidatus Thiodiazotropha sp.]
MNCKPIYPLLALLMLLQGCATPVTTPATGTESASPSAAHPASDNKETASEVTPSLVFNTLAGEIAAQRGESEAAYEYAYQAALESHNSAAAERATGLGLRANQPEQALQAAQLWIKIEPKSLKAQQIAAILNIRQRDLTAAIQHLQEVVSIANEQGQAGYLQAAAIAEKAASGPEALAIMQQLVPADSEDPDALYALALTASQAQQMELAGNYVDRSLKLEPHATNALVLKAHTLISSGKKEEGVSFLARAVAESPDNLPLRSAYARILVELDQAQTALEQYIFLHEKEPDNPDTLYALGILSMQLNRLDEAKRYLKQLVTNRQRSNEASFYLGVIGEEEQQIDQALDWYSRVEGDQQPDAQVRIAKILSDQGDLNAARETLQRLRVAHPHHHLRFYLIEAELLRENREYETANEVYTKALDEFEDNTELLYARGLNAADMDRVDILEQDLRKILATQPDHIDALNALGYTLADKTDRLDEAKAYIERALSMKPDSPAILDSMGWVEFRLGNLTEAQRYLEQAAKLSNDPEIASHLGEVLWTMGETDRAKAVWNAASQEAPDNRFIPAVKKRLGVTD